MFYSSFKRVIQGSIFSIFLVSANSHGSESVSPLSASDVQSDVSNAQVSATVSIVAANSAPSVSITSPAEGTVITEGDAIALMANASDSEDGDLSSLVVWSSNRDGVLGIGQMINPNLSLGQHQLTAAVTDTQGKSADASVSVYIQLPANQAPEVTITLPASGIRVKQGQSVQLSATALDPEEGDLSGQVIWQLNGETVLAEGTSAQVQLPLGQHQITARVSDSNTQVGQASVTVLVELPDNTMPTITLESSNQDLTVISGDLINLTASALDNEDGDITSSIQWRSNLSGPLAMGENLSAQLTNGRHKSQLDHQALYVLLTILD